MIDRYVCEVLPHKRPSMVYGQEHQLRWWKSQRGTQLLADVTPSVIVEYRNKLVREKSNSTANRYLAVLSHAFRFLSDEERERLLISCQQSRNPYLYITVILALSTGARRGE